MKKIAPILVLVFCMEGYSGDSTMVTDGFRVKPGFGPQKIVSTTVVGGLLLTSLVWSYDTWWKDTGRPFHFLTERWLDGPNLGIDKVGHFYTSYFYFHTFRNVMLWGGHKPGTATFWAMVSAGFFAVAVEVGDGVSRGYGFDYQDMVFNFAGIGYGFLQTEIPFLRNFQFKWSFVPNEGYRLPVRFTDNYDAHTYWLAMNVNNLLPRSLEPLWPDFLQIAVGMGVDDLVTKREFVIGFDFNLEALFKPQTEDWRLLFRTADLFHIPAPAVKLTESKEPRYYLFHRN